MSGGPAVWPAAREREQGWENHGKPSRSDKEGTCEAARDGGAIPGWVVWRGQLCWGRWGSRNGDEDCEREDGVDEVDCVVEVRDVDEAADVREEDERAAEERLADESWEPSRRAVRASLIAAFLALPVALADFFFGVSGILPPFVVLCGLWSG
ncbi:hypothetical protein Aph01nite_39780 [Acrocarpospora phusangensis]|uniref:Uncharacterized protein n=1 Tax=Acrocarpospora phusangensis TaxID=1070424 RepID=A0A919UPS6_9ACTN|nr:hypothetical protein Aph01nite_39780 [Acrocarpospora phusangensis]